MLAFSPSSLTLIKRLFSSSLFSALKVVSSAYLRLLIFVPATRWVADTSRPTELPWFTATVACSLGHVSEGLEEMAWVATGWVSEEEWAGWTLQRQSLHRSMPKSCSKYFGQEARDIL